MRPCNDNITKIFDWLYLGGNKNIRKTLPYIDVWFDFRWDRSYPKNFKIPENIIYIHKPFDDGNLEEAIKVWEECFKQVQKYKKDNKTVYITCYEGVSRSAVLTLWLCCNELNNYEDALNHLKSCRNIFPDKNFKPFLENLKEQYKGDNNEYAR